MENFFHLLNLFYIFFIIYFSFCCAFFVVVVDSFTWPAVWNVCVSVGGEQPIPLWNEHDVSTDGDKPKILLYSLNLTFKVWTSLNDVFYMVNSADLLKMFIFCRGFKWRPPLLQWGRCALKRAGLSLNCPIGFSARLLPQEVTTWSFLGNVKWISTWLWGKSSNIR